jgi:signal transduction histidine kinase
MGFYKSGALPRAGLGISLALLLIALVWFAMLSPPKLEAVGHALLWAPNSPEALSMQLKAIDIPSGTYRAPEDFERVPGVRVELPFFKVREDRSQLARLIYTLEINVKADPLDEASKPTELDSPALGVLFMQIISGGDFYLNGTWVGGLPRSSLSKRYVWYRPMLIPLPQHFLKMNGEPNVLTVVQTTHEPYFLLARPYVGNMSALNIAYEVALFFSTVLGSASNLLCLVGGLFMIGAWAASPKDTTFALAGAGTVLGALLFAIALWPYMPVSMYKIFRWWLYVFEAGFIALMSAFVLSFANAPLGPRARIALGLLSCIAPVVYAIGGSPTENWLDRLWTGPMILVYVYASFRLAAFCIRTRNRAALALLAQSLVSIVFAVHDYGVLTGQLLHLFKGAQSWRWPLLFFEPIYLTNLGLPISVMVLGGIFLTQYQRQVQRGIHTNKDLAESLRVREIELTKRYEAQAGLERKKAAHRERDRIYQDVHDGIGSRLVATLFSIRQASTTPNAIEAELQTCLDDLRLVINTQLEDSCDIQSTIFDYCIHLETQLEGSPLSIQYEISDGPAIHLLPKIHLNMMRILQEAVTNVIKHARASELLVILEQTDTALTLSISDNGRGQAKPLALSRLGELPAKGGRGLPGLAARARRLGGRCVVSDAAPGTKVHLWLPLIDSGRAL